MDLSFLTENSVIQAGGTVVALVAIALMFYMVKTFTKILGNHLTHTDKTQREDIESREKLAGIISTQTEISREILVSVKEMTKK